MKIRNFMTYKIPDAELCRVIASLPDERDDVTAKAGLMMKDEGGRE